MNILWLGMWACGQFSTGLSHAASHQSLFAEATRASELPNMALPPLPNVLLMSAPINLWFNTKAPVKWTWARILFCQLGGDEKDRIASLWISNARIIGRTSFSYLPSSCNVGIIGNQSFWVLVCSGDSSLPSPSIVWSLAALTVFEIIALCNINTGFVNYFAWYVEKIWDCKIVWCC